MDRPDTRQSEPRIPDRLAADLQGLFAGSPDVPAKVDRAMLLAASQSLSRIRRRRQLLRYWLPISSAAAACIAVSIVFWPMANRQPPIASDINADGQVNILDAFTLAKSLENPAADRPPQWDVNHDLRIDPLDVDAIARQAVALPAHETGGPRG